MTKLTETLVQWAESLPEDDTNRAILLIAKETILRQGLTLLDNQLRLIKLDALEEYGVDNWQGYDEAMLSIETEEEGDE